MTSLLQTPQRQPSRQASRGTSALVDLDPDLAAGLSGDRLADARATLRAAVRTVRRGEWRMDLGGPVAARSTGLLVLAGIVAREIVIEDVVSSELLGTGDLIVPWAGSEEAGSAGESVRWQVLADLHVAVLDPDVTRALAAFPELNQALIERVAAQGQRAAAVKAFSALNAVDRRLIALFRHLAQRWGRVTSRGIVIPLALSHRLLGELIGARRPTVSVAVGALATAGALERSADGTWRLFDVVDPAGEGAIEPAVTHRRRLLLDGHQAPEVGSDIDGVASAQRRFRRSSTM